jgi:hypothetical protein
VVGAALVLAGLLIELRGGGALGARVAVVPRA